MYFNLITNKIENQIILKLQQIPSKIQENCLSAKLFVFGHNKFFSCKQIVQQQFNFANFKIRNNIKNMMFYKDYEKKLQGFLQNNKKGGYIRKFVHLMTKKGDTLDI